MMFIKNLTICLSLLIVDTLCENQPRKENLVMLLRDDKTFGILEVSRPDNQIVRCTLYDIEKYPKSIDEAEQTFLKTTTLLPFDLMMQIIDHCDGLSENMLSTKPHPAVVLNNITEYDSLWRGIFPGTKWCGLGDEARHFEDLGQDVKVDLCCRSHDHCPVRLKAFGVDYGLVNLSVYTKSHCECDAKFLNCLKRAKSPLGDMIGNFYFNVMKVGCLKRQELSRCARSSVLRRHPLACDGQRTKGTRLVFAQHQFTY